MRFFVNVDHVATVREARKTDEPDPCEAALACEKGGADGITVHLREDRRHIQDDDVLAIAGAITGSFNLELASGPDIVELCVNLQPHQATLVPEKREEVTTEGGLVLSGVDDAPLRDTIARLAGARIRTSIFVDPDIETMDRSAELGVQAVELHTGEYANSGASPAELGRLQQAARYASEAGLAVHAGHGLNYENVVAVAAIPEIEELNIGHSIVSRSILVGIERAVAEMRSLIDGARV